MQQERGCSSSRTSYREEEFGLLWIRDGDDGIYAWLTYNLPFFGLPLVHD